MFMLSKIEKLFATSHNMFVPCLIFSFTLLFYYAGLPFSENLCQSFHLTIYLLSFGSFATLLYFNRGNILFLLLIITLNYILINLFKHLYGTEYYSSPFYINLSTLAPINFILFYFIRPRNLLSKSNIWLLLVIFTQFSLGELLGSNQIKLSINLDFMPATINIFSLLGFSGAIITSFIIAIRSGSIMNYHLFFAFLCQFFSFYYSNTPSGLSLFTFSTLLCMISGFCQDTYVGTYKDALTGLYSRNSYIIHTKTFPLKYSIGIISIDDYDKLGQNFGSRIRNTLTKLITLQISNIETDESIYRYNPDEFIIVFKNLNKKEGFEKLENIRRAIASAQFQYNPKRKPLKLTVSCSIAEKKRSDVSSFEVLQRADKVLQKARLFSHNITSQA